MAPTPTVTLAVHGLSCVSCERAVTTTASNLPSVASASVRRGSTPAEPSLLTLHLAHASPPEHVLAAVRAALPPKFSPIAVHTAPPHGKRPPQRERNSDHSGPHPDHVAAPSPTAPARGACRCTACSCGCSKANPGPVLVRVGLREPLPVVSTCVDGGCTDETCTCASSDSVMPSLPKDHPALAPSTTSDTAVLVVSGMTCASCVSKVEAILVADPGVHSASVSLLTARAALKVDPDIFRTENVIERLGALGFASEAVPSRLDHPDDIHLRFSDRTTAESAVASLRQSQLVASAEILEPVRTRNAPFGGDLLPKGVSRCCNHFSPDSCRTTKQKPSIIKLTTTDKLAAVQHLRIGSSSPAYEVLMRNDPQLTGGLEPSEVLRRAARHYLHIFMISFAFSLPVALVTMLFARVPALGSERLTQYVGGSGFRVVDIIAFVLTTPVQFGCGYQFYRGSWYSLKAGRANMDVLIAVGTSIAYLFSVIVLVLNTIQIKRGLPVTDEGVMFETSALLITIVLFGKWMETVAKKKTAAGVEALATLAPKGVMLVTPPPALEPVFEEPVHVELVSIGDFFRVNPGAAFPLDGVVEKGCTSVDESMLTGESWPVRKEEGDAVYAGTVNGANPVIIRCTATDSNSMVEKIINLVKQAQQSRAPIEAFADRVASVFVPAVIVIAVMSVLIWFVLAQTNQLPRSWIEGEGNVLFSLLFGLSVLVIACPCALGLATPTVIMVATTIGAQKLGILYKDGGEALQAAHSVKAVLFDKTGTLTYGNPVVTSVATVDQGCSDVTIVDNAPNEIQLIELLNIIAAAESSSDHPLARALETYVSEHVPSSCDGLPNITNHEAVPGRGIKCTLDDGRKLVIGQQTWTLSEAAEDFPPSTRFEQMLVDWEARGRTVVLAWVSDAPLLVFGIEDPVRAESAHVISRLQKSGVICGMVTGDGTGTAAAVSRIVGIPQEYIFARQLPADKVRVVKEFLSNAGVEVDEEARKSSSMVAFVGDGINDAGALSAASVGIAMGSGSQIAAESAAIVLVKSNLWDVVTALDLARKAFRRIKLNYVWALGYNCLAIPLAAGAVYPLLEKRIPPYAAAVAMGLSSVSVVVSSLLLGTYKSPFAQAASPELSM